MKGTKIILFVFLMLAAMTTSAMAEVKNDSTQYLHGFTGCGLESTYGELGLYFKPIEVVHEFYTKDSKATTADGKEETHRTGIKLKVGPYGHLFSETLTPGMVVGLSFGDAARITWSERQAIRERSSLYILYKH